MDGRLRQSQIDIGDRICNRQKKGFAGQGGAQTQDSFAGTKPLSFLS